MPSAGTISVTFGSPLVIVPVLSRATICTSPAVSSDSLVLNRTPFLAARPLPTMIATGVASPSAHGHEMTSTVIPRARASAREAPAISHPMTVIAAIPMTNGTKYPAMMSAFRAIGALVAAASDTILMICESVVSSPTLVARQRINPD